MRQTLFHIPHQLYGWPVFGAGWALLAWIVLGALLLGYLIRRQGWNRETRSYLPLLLIVAAAILFVLPVLEERDASGQILGLPIRGYGTMVLLGVVSGVALALREARRMGLDPESILSLAFWTFLSGILGARVFYIVQFWPQFHKETIQQTVGAMLNVTQGGLVVYGSVMGGFAGAVFYIRRRRLPLLAIADLVTPGMLLGLAFGRIGCLLNGCCYGGVCDGQPLGMTFPRESPPYVHQLGQGELHGIELGEDAGTGDVVVDGVAADSAADRAGVRVGDIVARLNGVAVDSLDTARRALAESPTATVELTTQDGTVRRWTVGKLPARSLPVHPTQLYSSINAAVLCLLLWSAYPFRRRDGEIFATMITLYPVTRFLLEWIRDDEPGRLGTPFTISQLISVGLVVLAAGLWWYLHRQPRGSRLPSTTEAAAVHQPT